MLERAERHRAAAERLEEKRPAEPEDESGSDRGTREPAAADPGADAATSVGADPSALRPPQGEPAGFSRRERELLQALSEGLRNDEIAEKLFISTGTVKWHLNNIYAKLGAKSRTDAVYRARNRGVIPS